MSARVLDLRTVRVDHGKGKLVLGVRFDDAGFGTAVGGGDVVVQDALHVFLDTPFPRYQEPRAIRVPRGDRERTGPGWVAAAAGDTVELRIEREDEQRRVLVHVWTDARRWDYLMNGEWLRLGGETR